MEHYSYDEAADKDGINVEILLNYFIFIMREGKTNLISDQMEVITKTLSIIFPDDDSVSIYDQLCDFLDNFSSNEP